MIGNGHEEGARALSIHIEDSAGLPEGKPLDDTLLMRIFVRRHWDDQVVYRLRGMSGEGPSVTSSVVGDEWELARDLQNLAQEEGQHRLAALTRDDFRRKARFAINYITKIRGGMSAIQHQGKTKLLEDKRARRAAGEPSQEAAE